MTDITKNISSYDARLPTYQSGLPQGDTWDLKSVLMFKM